MTDMQNRIDNRNEAPLDGLMVVDFSRMLSGPLSTMILGDLGAHVIRVEDVEGTDTTRHNHPFIKGESHYFLSINRNKESIAIDLKTPEGNEIGALPIRDMINPHYQILHMTSPPTPWRRAC